ncbi:hypothetical protein HNQ04_003583 [Deinococcus radiopugnans ATCC 19172]|uniref:Transposase n=1 Tax=Deinococcus radiopugnans ATCC 19172 TaxID=585398 RepID=A0ABR6NW79_9DEIO|nr:hypothetical protein [Deinococcus radiopugnans ATCC 19172]
METAWREMDIDQIESRDGQSIAVRVIGNGDKDGACRCPRLPEVP